MKPDSVCSIGTACNVSAISCMMTPRLGEGQPKGGVQELWEGTAVRFVCWPRNTMPRQGALRWPIA